MHSQHSNVSRQASVRSTISMATDYGSDDDMQEYYNDVDVDLSQYSQEPSGGHFATPSEKPRLHRDPEYFQYSLMDTAGVRSLLQETTEAVKSTCNVTKAEAEMLLQKGNWNVSTVVRCLKRNNSHLSDNNNDMDYSSNSPTKRLRLETQPSCAGDCLVCFCPTDRLKSPDCGHGFCHDCWALHISTQINSGVFSHIQCMDPDCENLVSEEFALRCIDDVELRHKFQEFLLRDRVVSHELLRFCPGRDCQRIVQATTPSAGRVLCDQCKCCFCFACGNDYHAPMSCPDINKWLQKCEDDSETANYITANTKDCPKCNVCIEKNGGCNHMSCFKCSYDFCWMCLGDWSCHNSYYECSKYKVNANSKSNEARNSLEKYLFYFQRWENHTRSLQLEQETRMRIQEHIENKVMSSDGTWIDWQYLLDACDLLHRCRYTLKFTCPFAYFLDSGSSKECFEHIQAQLEVEVENLSWKVERATITDRGDLERQMDVAEKRRRTLLQDWLKSRSSPDNLALHAII